MLPKDKIAHDLTLLSIKIIVDKGLEPANAEHDENGALKLNLSKLYSELYPGILKDIDRYLNENS